MKKILATIVCLASVITLATPVFAVTEIPDNSDLTVKYVSVINDDEAFPLNAELVFDEGSIHFSETDCYECEYEVDKSQLRAEVILSSKDESSDFSFSLTDENATVFDMTSQDSELSIASLQFDKYYQFRLTMSGNIYAGEMGIIFETCNVVYIDFSYLLINSYSSLQRSNQSFMYEIENNNNYSQADTIYPGRTMVGTPSNINDTDYFYIDTGLNNPTMFNSHYANGTLDITLSSPSSSINTYIIKLYTVENDELIFETTSLSATGKCRYIRYVNTYGYREFYISVTPVSAAVYPDTEYYLNVNYTGTYTFYSQKKGKIGSLETWNTQFLDELTSADGKPFITVNDMNDTDHMSVGCAIASYAMALRNVNATIPGKDFRTGFTGNLYADPFTVMMANSGIDGTSMTNYSENPLPNNSPCYIYRTNLISRFTVNSNTLYSHCYYLGLYNSVDLETALDYILEHNGSYGAIITFTNSYGNTHYMVVTGKDDSQTDLKNKYTVFDPSGTTFAHAKGLKYSSCVSYTRTGAHHMELSDVVAIHYFNRNSQPFTIQ